MYKLHPPCLGLRLEWIILRWDLVHEVIANNRQLAENIFPDLWDLAEEEEREDACRDAEAG